MTREKPENVRTGQTHKATIRAMPEDGTDPVPVEFFIISNTFPDGRLCEIFLTTRKEGSTIDGLLDCIATLTSFCLQSGWPLYKLVEKFGHSKFEPMGYTQGETPIRYAKSIVDYIFRYLGETYGGIHAELEHPGYDAVVELPPTTATVVIVPEKDAAVAESTRLALIAAHRRIVDAKAEQSRTNEAAAKAWHDAHPQPVLPDLPDTRPMPMGETVVHGDEPRG